MQHELKIWPQYFQAVLEGRKTFEMRRDDRGFKVGDSLRLREWDQVLCQHTGRELVRTVTYCLHGGNFGLAEGWVVMGLAAAEQPVARFTGAHGGRWTFAMLDPAAVPHDGMALYAGPAAQVAVKESLTTGKQPVADDVVRDAERLDFLISEGASVMKYQREGSPAHYWLRWEHDESEQVDSYPSPREAIDAAMRDAAMLAAQRQGGE